MNIQKFEIQPKKKFEVNHEFKTYDDEVLISEVKPIEQGMIDAGGSNNLETLIEYPLLDATKTFFKKGIKTWSSSANQKDVNGEAYIILYYDLLSPNNKKIAESFGDISEYLKEKFIKINIPIEEKTTVGYVRRKFKEIADTFESQI